MTFQPAWWCRNRHLQTIWGPLFRRRDLPLRRERLGTRDGDFVDLHWLDGPAGTPVLLVLHGLEGSARSHYAAGLVAGARDRGWRAVVLHFRSCSGEPNRLARFYHAGDTDDLDTVVHAFTDREPHVPLLAAGVSIGGNVLLKWLGERGDDAPAALRAAVGISVPFDLAMCARALDRGLARVLYTENFLRSFRAKVRAKAACHPGFVDVRAALRARTFAEYDRAVTAPLHGFADEVDYWTRASSGRWLSRIRRPVLLLSARDDPFVPREALPGPDTLPACVRAEFSPSGGHVGFIAGRWPWAARSWAESRSLEFLASVLAAGAGPRIRSVLAGEPCPVTRPVV